jgi:phosphoribosylamine--glycine ligase
MRFLGLGETCDLGALYMRLLDEGHEVRVLITDPQAHGTMAGIIDRATDLQSGLAWVQQAENNGIIIFESVSEGLGTQQDALRRQGFHVIGGSAYGDRLENDRAYAQELLASIGFPKGHVWEFSDADSGMAFLAAHPGRYVLKLCGPDHASQDNYIGQLDDGSDVRAMLAARVDQSQTFILMEFIDGIEMGIGAYFDGEDFLQPACLDWEHKRFFAGDMGELTGEMGTVATFDRSRTFYARTLAKLVPHLRDKEHIGYVNLNTIVNDQGIWPLEFTCRFGYPGFAVLDPLQNTPWGKLFARMIVRTDDMFETRPGFSVGVVVTTPPFPYSRKQVTEPVGLPISLFNIGTEDRRHLHYGEVGMQRATLVTSGLYGWTMVATGVAPTIKDARSAVYERLSRIVVPNGRYRLDIGERLDCGDFERLEMIGVLDDQ